MGPISQGLMSDFSEWNDSSSFKNFCFQCSCDLGDFALATAVCEALERHSRFSKHWPVFEPAVHTITPTRLFTSGCSSKERDIFLQSYSISWVNRNGWELEILTPDSEQFNSLTFSIWPQRPPGGRVSPLDVTQKEGLLPSQAYCKCVYIQYVCTFCACGGQ